MVKRNLYWAAVRTLAIAVAAAAALGGAQEKYDKRAPFSGLRWNGETPEVDVAGTWFELVAIDKTPAKDIVEFCKKTWPDLWKKRFGEDLVEALMRMGKPVRATVELEVKELDSGKARVLKGVRMTADNRESVKNPLTRAGAVEDLEQLRGHLEDRYSYLMLRGWDWKQALDGIRSRLKDPPSRGALALELMRFMARFGDGHSGLEEDLIPAGFAPYLVGDAGGRLVAFHAHRRDFLDPGRPYLKSIDGMPVDKWLEAAAKVVPSGSPAFVRNQSVRMLRNLAFMREELGLPFKEDLKIELESEDRADARSMDLKLAGRRSTYGEWPRGGYRDLEGGLAYLRIEEMSENPEFLKDLAAKMGEFRETKGLVIDVRGNGGGTRDVLRALFPYFMKAGEGPHVANVAAYRLPGGEPALAKEGYLQDRELYPISSDAWSAEDRAALEKFATSFKPEWTPPADKFSAWHYFVLKPGGAPFTYDKPVVILMDANCFSATDIFLGAFKGRRNVTLMGAASGGGSGRARQLKLKNSLIRLKLSTIASFRRDGSLYDGKGVPPDVEVVQKATDFLVGKGDSVLEAAIRRIRQ